MSKFLLVHVESQSIPSPFANYTQNKKINERRFLLNGWPPTARLAGNCTKNDTFANFDAKDLDFETDGRFEKLLLLLGGWSANFKIFRLS